MTSEQIKPENSPKENISERVDLEKIEIEHGADGEEGFHNEPNDYP